MNWEGVSLGVRLWGVELGFSLWLGHAAGSYYKSTTLLIISPDFPPTAMGR
jgi:hypothetical protein